MVAAVAARDLSRAQAFATKQGIARVHDSYEALVADPDLDAIYNPLPIGLHGKGLGSDCRGEARVVRKAVHCQCRRGPRGRRTGRHVGPGLMGHSITATIPVLRGSKTLSPQASCQAGGGGSALVLLDAKVLRYPL